MEPKLSANNSQQETLQQKLPVRKLSEFSSKIKLPQAKNSQNKTIKEKLPVLSSHSENSIYNSQKLSFCLFVSSEYLWFLSV